MGSFPRIFPSIDKLVFDSQMSGALLAPLV